MTDSDPDSITNINRSGGADLSAGRDINVDGDVAGRDIIKVTNITDAQQYDVHGLANPYLGLQSFTYADHAKYAGREKLIVETVARLTTLDDPLALLFITGASGSGKSSFVQAGVLSALEKHYAALRVKWAVFRPSHNPLAALADALWRQLGLPQFDAHVVSPADFGDFLETHTPSQQVNVIVIDQFEELFTQSNAQPCNALFALLTHLPPFRMTRTHIIATVRADYLPELFALPTLYDIAKRGIDLRVMSVDELREVIQQPLRATYPDNNKRFRAELVERLAQDAAEDAAYLPLLQVTLEEIWRKGTLTVGSYTNLADAIKQRADKVLAYQDYDAAQPNQPRISEEQAAILNLCLDLVDVSLDDEARRDVRRRRSKDELVSGAPERARLIDTLTQARLLSVDTEHGEPARVEVDLIHETLLSNWDHLRQAVAERRHELRQRVRFEQQLKEWIGQNRVGDYLLGGVRLAEARDLEHRDDVALHNADAKDYFFHSVEREEVERQREKARQLEEIRRLRIRNRIIGRLAEAVGRKDKFAARFELPVQDEQVYLSRTHPIVEGLATYVMDTALDPIGEGIARRCGVIRTSKVEKRTTLLLVRFRYHILTKRGETEQALLAEDCQLLAFAGSAEKAQWLDGSIAEELLLAQPDANVHAEQARDFLQKVLDGFEALRPHLNEVDVQHGEELLEQHRRVRMAARMQGVSHQRALLSNTLAQ